MTDVSAEATLQHAQALEAIVSDVVEGQLPLSEFAKRLQDAGASQSKARTIYINLPNNWSSRGRTKRGKDSQTLSLVNRQIENLLLKALARPRQMSSVVSMKLSWRRFAFGRLLIVTQQLMQQHGPFSSPSSLIWQAHRALLIPHHPSQPMILQNYLELGVKCSAPQSLPASILALALHLAELLASTISDPHIKETWKLQQAIGTDKTIDSLINLMQVQPLADPIPCSIWCLVIQDHFVNFKKLFASMDKGYDNNNKPHDFGGG